MIIVRGYNIALTTCFTRPGFISSWPGLLLLPNYVRWLKFHAHQFRYAGAALLCQPDAALSVLSVLSYLQLVDSHVSLMLWLVSVGHWPQVACDLLLLFARVVVKAAPLLLLILTADAVGKWKLGKISWLSCSGLFGAENWLPNPVFKDTRQKLSSFKSVPGMGVDGSIISGDDCWFWCIRYQNLSSDTTVSLVTYFGYFQGWLWRQLLSLLSLVVEGFWW